MVGWGLVTGNSKGAYDFSKAMDRNFSQVQLTNSDTLKDGVCNPAFDINHDQDSNISCPPTDKTNGYGPGGPKVEEAPLEQEPNRCAPCIRRCAPCLRSQNPLPASPTFCDQFKHGFMLPPAGLFAKTVSCAAMSLLVFACAWTITGNDGLPGGNLFGIIVTTVFAFLLGWVAEKLHLPPLLGK